MTADYTPAGPLRIALVPSAFHPRVGGVEELTLRLAQALQSAGDLVEVWTPTPAADGSWGSHDVEGVATRRIPMSLEPLRPVAAARFARVAATSMRALLRAHRDLRPDVIHVQCFSGNGAFATALSSITRTPLIVTLQGETFMDDHNIYAKSLQMRAALRLGLRRASRITACSQYTLDDAIARFGADPSKSTVIFNGVDLEEASDTKSAPIGGRYVLAVGRIVHNKGLDLLIDAFSEVANRHSDVVLTIAGDGPELPVLRERITDLGLNGRIELLGRADRPTVARLMAAAEVVVVPSRVEPFGIVVLEAWRAGRPVVASNHGGISEFLTDGETGRLIDPFDRGAFGRVLDELLANPHMRRGLGEASRRAVPAFEWKKIRDRYRRLYRVVAA